MCIACSSILYCLSILISFDGTLVIFTMTYMIGFVTWPSFVLIVIDKGWLSDKAYQFHSFSYQYDFYQRLVYKTFPYKYKLEEESIIIMHMLL